jgi:hypothetical protein
VRRGDAREEGGVADPAASEAVKELVEIGRMMVCCPPNAQISEKMRRGRASGDHYIGDRGSG